MPVRTILDSRATPPRPDELDITVLVLLREEERHVREAINAMQGQDFEGRVEFLLLDGGSRDATVRELTRLTQGDGRFHIFVKPGWSIPRRLNFGLTTARGRLIARMDAHAVFPPNYLSDGARRLAAGDVASVSGPQIASGDGRWSRPIAIAQRSPLGRGGARFRQLRDAEIEVDSGYCGIWPRRLLVAHGGWDERAVKGEDMELAFRIRMRGGRIVCMPSMAARYVPRETLGGLALQYWRYAERRAWAATLNPRILRRSHLLPPALALALLVALAGPPTAAPRARQGLRIYGAGILIETVRVGRRERAADVVALPPIFLTMHLAWGTGFLLGCLVNGAPRISRLVSRSLA